MAILVNSNGKILVNSNGEILTTGSGGSSGGSGVIKTLELNWVTITYEEGMTWQQFIDSSYNVDGFEASGGDVYLSGSQLVWTDGQEDYIVSPSDVIDNTLTYQWWG